MSPSTENVMSMACSSLVWRTMLDKISSSASRTRHSDPAGTLCDRPKRSNATIACRTPGTVAGTERDSVACIIYPPGGRILPPVLTSAAWPTFESRGCIYGRTGRRPRVGCALPPGGRVSVRTDRAPLPAGAVLRGVPHSRQLRGRARRDPERVRPGLRGARRLRPEPAVFQLDLSDRRERVSQRAAGAEANRTAHRRGGSGSCGRAVAGRRGAGAEHLD